MNTTQPVMGTNRLVTSLPSKERKQLLENCEPIQLFFGEELYRAGESISPALKIHQTIDY